MSETTEIVTNDVNKNFKVALAKAVIGAAVGLIAGALTEKAVDAFVARRSAQNETITTS